ncbi:hypothetical protein E2C01_100444 [Portunus trituberculatus]|uniref:Uncharacterized protein n=1 Tax=Portunus trituberculatus TaxID=210409 RepID=A0A5B7KHZ7_PORTR|nr:hypothetical protein [Portunus trituberculatus]
MKLDHHNSITSAHHIFLPLSYRSSPPPPAATITVPPLVLNVPKPEHKCNNESTILPTCCSGVLTPRVSVGQGKVR